MTTDRQGILPGMDDYLEAKRLRLYRRRRLVRPKRQGKRPVVKPEVRSELAYRRLMLKLHQMYPDEHGDEDRLLALAEAVAEYEGRRVDDRESLLKWIDNLLSQMDETVLHFPV